MNSKNADQQIAHQELALDAYLTNLLDEIPSDSVADEPFEHVGDETSTSKGRIKQEKLALETRPPNIDFQPQAQIRVGLEKKVKPLLVMPDWSLQEFQAVIFKVGKLVFATPVKKILKTIKFDRKPTRILGQPIWFIGLLNVHGRRIGVLNTEILVSGQEKKQHKSCKVSSFEYLLITTDGHWGFVCDEVLAIRKFKPEKIKWRSMRAKRSWLIGTLIEELVAVIDVNLLMPNAKSR